MKRLLPSLVLGSLALFAPAMEGEKVFERGYVTAIRSSSDFDVNGFRIVYSSKTRTQGDAPMKTSGGLKGSLPTAPYLGQMLEVDGEMNRGAGTITTDAIKVLPPPNRHVNGLGIVDALPASLPNTQDREVRADGYILLLPPSAKLSFIAPLASTSALTTNLWIRYSGEQREDGVVVLDTAETSINTVVHSEDKLRRQSDFDPAVIDEGDKQGGMSKAFFGVDRKRIPAWKDAAMQARIERIGASLVPAYQKALPSTEPTRIDFRFQVVDLTKKKDALAMDSGIILIPYQVVEKLENDAQIAAILADNVAQVLEKQDFRGRPAQHKLTAVNVLGEAAGLVVPGAGLATGLGTYTAGKHIEAHQLQQSSRVSLCLLHDAGYDITQAPLAWWRLQIKAGKDLVHTGMPDRALFLYENLGTTWAEAAAHTENTVTK